MTLAPHRRYCHRHALDERFYSGDAGVKTLDRGGTYTLTVGSGDKPATGSYTMELTPRS